MTLRFLHLSDIHFGQENAGTFHIHTDIRRKLLEDVQELARKRGPATSVLVNGDIAYSGREDEYKDAGEWLDQVCSAIGCHKTRVLVVPGNHDCDLAKNTGESVIVEESIRGKRSPEEANTQLSQLMNERGDSSVLLLKMKAYRDFASGYSCDFSSPGCQRWEKHFPIADGVELAILGLNSVQVSGKNDKPGDLILGASQYTIEEAKHKILGILMHHPTDWLRDKNEARRYLHSRSKLIMTGHEHYARLMTTKEGGRERIELYAGAVNSPDDSSEYRHAYNWIELELESGPEGYFLLVQVYPRVWNLSRTAFAANYDHLPGPDKEYEEVRVPLEGLVPSHGKISEPGLTEPTASGEIEGRTMAGYDQTDVAKLRLYFWRYLTWRERVMVLALSDAIPKTAEKPLPQTLERLALEAAENNHLLDRVWDSMLAYLPADKREPNPFER